MGSPSWDRLFEIAAAQEGLFTTQQAALAGYSPQLIAHHLKTGRMTRILRVVYRLAHYPAGDHEDLTAVWLWSDRKGVFSHQTALALHNLSDLLPSQVHLTLPHAWRKRRLSMPEGVTLHFKDVLESERCWFGQVPATTVARSLENCADGDLSPKHLGRAALDALSRSLVSLRELTAIDTALAGHGGLGP